MLHFASRNSALDAVRRGRMSLDLLAFWTIPVALLGAWLLAGGFTVSALASATAAWQRRPPAIAPVGDRLLVPPAAALPAVSATRRCRLARPARPDQQRAL